MVSRELVEFAFTEKIEATVANVGDKHLLPGHQYDDCRSAHARKLALIPRSGEDGRAGMLYCVDQHV